MTRMHEGETAADPAVLVSRMFAAIDERRWSAFPAIFDPAIAYHRPGYRPIAGLESLIRFYEVERVVASGAHHIAQVIVGTDGALASWGHFSGTLRDGRETRLGFSEIYQVVSGRLAVRRTFFDCPAI